MIATHRAVIVGVVAMMASVGCLALADSGDSVALYDGDWSYDIEANTATITGYRGTIGNIIIPELVGGYAVRAIGASAFQANTIIAGVTIGAQVLHIGTDSFRGCVNLTSVTIEGNPTMGNFVFRDCTRLASVDLGNELATVGFGAFNSCTNLTSVAIPASVTLIRASFNWCKGLSDVTISSEGGSLAIEGAAFRDTGISSIGLPYRVSSISNTSFANNVNLTDVRAHYSLELLDGTFDGSHYDLQVTRYANLVIDSVMYHVDVGTVPTVLGGQTWYDDDGHEWENLTAITEDVTLTSIEPLNPIDPPTDPPTDTEGNENEGGDDGSDHWMLQYVPMIAFVALVLVVIALGAMTVMLIVKLVKNGGK